MNHFKDSVHNPPKSVHRGKKCAPVCTVCTVCFESRQPADDPPRVPSNTTRSPPGARQETAPRSTCCNELRKSRDGRASNAPGRPRIQGAARPRGLLRRGPSDRLCRASPARRGVFHGSYGDIWRHKGLKLAPTRGKSSSSRGDAKTDRRLPQLGFGPVRRHAAAAARLHYALRVLGRRDGRWV